MNENALAEAMHLVGCGRDRHGNSTCPYDKRDSCPGWTQAMIYARVVLPIVEDYAKTERKAGAAAAREEFARDLYQIAPDDLDRWMRMNTVIARHLGRIEAS